MTYVATTEQQGKRRVLSQRQLCASCGAGTFIGHAAQLTAECEARGWVAENTVFLCDDCEPRCFEPPVIVQ